MPTHQSTRSVVVKFDQRSQIASLPIARIEKGTRIAKTKADIVAAAAPFPFALGKCDVLQQFSLSDSIRILGFFSCAIIRIELYLIA